ncbi:MAG: sulfurtransferase TusA family protein, partial [Nitrospirota bacterium]|nr:sulfurtransferase TusA family protein [Nitrospirota bacterium]
LNCPLPVLRARKRLRQMPAGALLRIEATDPGTVRDVQAMCDATGDELLESKAEQGEFSFLIRRNG